MATVRSATEYGRLMNKRAQALRKQSIRTASQAATFMQGMAKLLAPRGTGETIEGIKKSKQGKSYIIVSDVVAKGKKRFKQNMWANQTFPHRTIRPHWPRFAPEFKGGVVYGDGSHRITGMPRFFHIATLRTRHKFKQLARQNTRKALQVSI